MSSETDATSLAIKLNDPNVIRSLNRLIDRAEQVDSLMEKASQAQAAVPNLLGTMVDIADSMGATASANGIDVEERSRGLLKLALRLSEPETLRAADELLNELPKLTELSKLLAEAPNLTAIFLDVLDEWTQGLKDEGIDLETSLRQGLHAALWLGGRISETELERLGVLLRSDVLDQHAVDVVALAGASLAKCQQDSCELDAPDRVGLLGMIGALRDPNTQRALGFALRFAKCFGNSMNTKNTK